MASWQQYLAILEARHGIARSDANVTYLVEKPSKPSAKRYTVIIETSSDKEQEQPTSPCKKVSVMPWSIPIAVDNAKALMPTCICFQVR
jgi:hypothetical protein